jgi:hypothetical protein
MNFGHSQSFSIRYKMKGKKSKGKSKGKKSSVKDKEWTHEGGISYGESKVEDEVVKPRFRKTQDKDEKFRRSRFKQEIARQSKQFVDKMKNKLTFKDFVMKDLEKDKADAVNVVSVQTKHFDVAYKNPKSAAQRLHEMLNPEASASWRASEGDSESDDDMHAVDDDGDDDEDASVEPMDHNSSSVVPQHTAALAFDIDANIDDHDVNEDEVDSDGDEGVTTKDDAYSDFFTYAVESISDEREKPKSLSLIDTNLEVYGTLNPDFSINRKLCQLQDIPGLHKLFKSRRHETLEPPSQILMPYLTSYSDMLIETCVSCDPASCSYSVLLHSLIHILRARY